MAVHARLSRRNVRDGRNLDRGVTVAAIEAELADVEFMAERDGCPRLCTTGKSSTRRLQPRAPDRGCPRVRRRSGACSTMAERSGPTARTPGRWRTVAQAANLRWTGDAVSAAQEPSPEGTTEIEAECYPRTLTGSS